MSKRKIILLTAITIAIVIFSVLISSYRCNPHQAILSAKITNFSSNGYLNPGGLIWNVKFIIGITNNGSRDIDNITLTFNTSSPIKVDRSIIITDSQDIMVDRLTMGQTYALGTLKIGQNETVFGYIEDNILDYAKIDGYPFTATLMAEGSILDRASVGTFYFPEPSK